MRKIRILVADDDDAVRAALCDLLRTQGEVFDLVGAAADAEMAVGMAKAHLPDVALVDVKMPGGGGPAATRGIRDAGLATQVVAISAYGDRETVIEMLRAGASGYLVKGASADEVIETIRRADAGEGTLSGDIAGDVIHELSQRLLRDEEEESYRRNVESKVREVLDGARQSILFQPVVDLPTGRAVGFEALSRFAPRDGEPVQAPDVWFAEAHGVGLGLELELLAVQRAREEAVPLGSDVFLSVNLSPSAFESQAFEDLLPALHPAQLVVEITEHARIDEYGRLLRAIERLRERGGRLAVDDAGAGFASLRHILRLHPDLIKLDNELVKGLHDHQPKRALASGLISFARELGAEIVAEGVETAEELEALMEVGVPLGQGFHLGRPAPAETFGPPSRA